MDKREKDIIVYTLENKVQKLEIENEKLKQKLEILSQNYTTLNENYLSLQNEFKYKISRELLSYPEEQTLIKKFIGKPFSTSLIYKASKDGDSASSFHWKCDGHFPTIVFIQTIDGKKFGGYCSKPWTSDGKYYEDENCFLFSIDLRKKYPVINKSYAICGNGEFGAYFGLDDLIVYESCLSNKESYISSKINKKSYDTSEIHDLIYGEKDNDNNANFQVKECEVYEIKFF